MFPARFTALIELIATVAVVLLLAAVSRPLATAPGIDLRYVNGPPHIVRAGAMQSEVGRHIAVVAGAGLAVLIAGRSRLPAAAFASIAAAAWTFAASHTPAFEIERRLADPAVLVLLLIAWLALRRGRARHSCRPASSWRYPGWLLFTGIGVLWLVDYAARGYPKFAGLGLKQAQALFLATAVMSVIAGLWREIVDGLMRALAYLDSAALPASPTAKAMALLLGMIWAGIVVLLTRGDNANTALVGEIVRVPIWVLLAWTAFRWIDTSIRRRRALLAATGLGLLLLAGMAINHGDQGQVLLFGIVVAIFASVGVGNSRALALVVAILGLTAIYWGITQLLPAYFETLKWRVEAMGSPQQSHLDFLARLGWFIDAAPTFGFRLGHVHWCGIAGSLGGVCDGVPRQIQHDYVVAALAGVIGKSGAVVISIALATWLLAMLRTPPGNASGERFRHWLLLTFVAAQLAQLSLTVLGTLGQLPLTGVVYPCLSAGTTSLLVVGVFVGLAMNEEKPQ